MGTFRDIARLYAERLRGVSSSTKMLAVSLSIIVVMGLFLVSLYAGTAEMVPLPVTLAGESRSRTVDYLTTRGLVYQLSLIHI